MRHFDKKFRFLDPLDELKDERKMTIEADAEVAPDRCYKMNTDGNPRLCQYEYDPDEVKMFLITDEES